MKKTKRSLALLLSLILILGLAGCGAGADSAAAPTPAVSVAPTAPAGMTPGVYTVTARGCYGDFTIDVTVDESSISDIQLINTVDSKFIGQKAQAMVISNVLEDQSTDVDGMTGATVSSMTMKSAVRQALTQAGAPADMLSADKTSEALANCKGDIADFKPDIIVVGAGIAGLTASLTAAKEGKNVLVLEHMPHFGGSSMYSGGAVASAGSETQADKGVVTDPELFYEGLCDNAGDNPWFRPELAHTYAYNSGAATDVLTEMGVTWGDASAIGGSVSGYDTSNLNSDKEALTSVAAYIQPAGYTAWGWDIFDETRDAVQKYVDAGTYAYLLNTTATELITDGSGAVIGVKAEDKNGAESDYYAKAVILCCGGYAANDEMLSKELTRYARSTTLADIGNMFEAAENVGAVMFGTDFCRTDGGVLPTRDDNGFAEEYEIKYNLPGAVWLNEEGVRFWNEGTSGNQDKWRAWYDAEDNTVYVLMNQALVDSANVLYYGNYAGYSEDVGNVVFNQFAEDNYFVSKGDTIEEAAEKAGLDPTAVADTLATYDNYCATGVDKDFSKSADKLIALDKGPYYIVETIPSVKSTLGGLRIDDNARVLNASDEPIAGLYAAGETTGIAANLGDNWYGGPNLQSGSTFGYTAVHTILEDFFK